jgi:RING finger protein 113A
VRPARKRARTPSPPSAEKGIENATAGEDNVDEGRRAVGSVARKAAKGAETGGVKANDARPSWRDEYRAKASTGDAIALLATAGRHEIDAADIGTTASNGTPAVKEAGTRAEQEAAARARDKKKKTFGPLRAPTHIRTTIHLDVRPDICKDYQQTGYCGFGDSCIFLHDRTVYRKAAQVEKEWEELQEARRAAVARGDDPDAVVVASRGKDSDVDGLPFACFICRKPFRVPIVTLCDHYFCEACAVKRMATDSTCAVCNKPLRGVLNTATKMVAKQLAAAVAAKH